MTKKKKFRGVLLLEAVLAILILGLLTYGVGQINSIYFAATSSISLYKRAQMAAQQELDTVKSTTYQQSSGITHGRAAIPNSKDGLESKVSLINDIAYDDNIKVRVFNLEVFKPGRNTPEYSKIFSIATQPVSGGGTIGYANYNLATLAATFHGSGDSPYTVPEDGYLNLVYSSGRGRNSTGQNTRDIAPRISISGSPIIIAASATNRTPATHASSIIPVVKGDVINVYVEPGSTGNLYFIPYRTE